MSMEAESAWVIRCYLFSVVNVSTFLVYIQLLQCLKLCLRKELFIK